jgi:hypothetical protein
MTNTVKKIDINLSILFFLRKYEKYNPRITYIKDIGKVMIKIDISNDNTLLLDKVLLNKIHKEMRSLENYLIKNIEYLPNNKVNFSIKELATVSIQKNMFS